MHWGNEYELYPSPLILDVARKVASLGADIILGHHSHIVQPAEMLFVNGEKAELTAPQKHWRPAFK